MSQTLESKIESSLLCRQTDGKQAFVHDTYKEYFLAKFFADRINNNKLSIKDAYQKFWSYVEDKKLWDLEKLSDDECRALLPAWNNVLLYLAGMLKAEKARTFVSIASRSYKVAEKKLNSEEYNPFFDNIYFISGFIINSKIAGEDFGKINKLLGRENLKSKRAVRPFTNYFSNSDNLDIARDLGNLKKEKVVERLIKSLFNPGNKDICDVLFKLGNLKSEKAVEPLIKYISNHSNPERAYAVFTLSKMGGEKAVESLIWYLSDPVKRVQEAAAFYLGDMGSEKAIEPLIKYFSNSSNPRRYYVLEALGKLGNRDMINRLKVLTRKHYPYKGNYAIHLIHRRLKPQGYIAPQTKELAA
jgi:hypothetical protein